MGKLYETVDSLSENTDVKRNNINNKQIYLFIIIHYPLKFYLDTHLRHCPHVSWLQYLISLPKLSYSFYYLVFIIAQNIKVNKYRHCAFRSNFFAAWAFFRRCFYADAPKNAFA